MNAAGGSAAIAINQEASTNANATHVGVDVDDVRYHGSAPPTDQASVQFPRSRRSLHTRATSMTCGLFRLCTGMRLLAYARQRTGWIAMRQNFHLSACPKVRRNLLHLGA